MTDDDKALDKIIRASMPFDFERKETLSDDKALVKWLREMADEYDSGHHESWPTIDAFNQAADRIETLNAMLKAAEESLGDQLAARKEQADRIEAQAAEIEELKSWKSAEDAHHHKLRAEIERLREAGDRLVVFVRHYQRCATTRGRDYCNCDHDIVIKAWKEARSALGDTK